MVALIGAWGRGCGDSDSVIHAATTGPCAAMGYLLLARARLRPVPYVTTAARAGSAVVSVVTQLR